MSAIEKIVRVYCLYRVSSKGQVDHDDIPVQKKACHSFVENKANWKIIREEKELGVSGSKVSAEKRDILQEYIENAKQGMFDVLLVFMFDRLGRIEHETPFVLEGFVNSGVECWSVCEGQQKIDNHVDKLMNYIRFWQAAGETQKMSQRIGETHSQIVESGHFRGGHVPFGYRLVDKGRRNKKDLPLMDLEVDPVTGRIAEEIFHETVYEGVGSHSLATKLNKRGITHNTGSKFNSNTILRILKNPVYTGYYVTKRAKSPHQPDLQIISIEVFNKAVEILHDRSLKQEEKRKISARTRNGVLLSGNIYCGHCNTRLSSFTHVDKRKRADGSLYERETLKYACYHKTRGLTDCDGQHHYLAGKIDDTVLGMTMNILAQFRSIPKDTSVEWRVGKRVYQLQQAQKEVQKKLDKSIVQLERLNGEVAKCLMGESNFTEETLTEAILTTKAATEQVKQERDAITNELQNQTITKHNISKYYDEFESWSNEFERASIERKRMILCELYDRIEVRKGYAITLYVNENYKQFLEIEAEEKSLASSAG